MNLSELRELGAKPIRADAPGGDSIRDEPEFEKLQLELRKLELADHERPKWGEVIETAAAILQSRSKDILVAAWLTQALLERDGLEGLACGLQIIRDLVHQQWETMHPSAKRIRGRLGALEWLSSRAARTVKRHSVPTDAIEAVREMHEHVIELSTAVSEKGDVAPTIFGKLQVALQESIEIAEQEAARAAAAAAPAAAATTAAPAAGGAAAPAMSAEAIASGSDASRLLGEIRDACQRLAAYYRAAEPQNPLGYSLPRAMAWIHLAQLPPHENGITQIPPIQPPDLGEEFRDMLAQQQWAGVLEQTENRFVNSVLWLDLHRFAFEALEAQGPELAPAAEVIAQQVANLLMRLPGLERLKFRDETPLADDATLTWIRDRVRPAQGGASGGGHGVDFAERASGETSAEDAPFVELAAARIRARALARHGKFEDALQGLEDGAARCRTLPARAGWVLQIGLLCLEKGRPSAAYARLCELEATLAHQGLDEWDPGFSVAFLKALFIAHDKVLSSLKPPPAEELARSLDLQRRLSRLDIVAATKLTGRR